MAAERMPRAKKQAPTEETYWEAPDAWEMGWHLPSSHPLVIPAAQFKAHCLRLLDDVAAGHEVLVTKRGRPVALVIAPTRSYERMDLTGTVVYESDEDLMEPTGVQWPGEDD